MSKRPDIPKKARRHLSALFILAGHPRKNVDFDSRRAAISREVVAHWVQTYPMPKPGRRRGPKPTEREVELITRAAELMLKSGAPDIRAALRSAVAEKRALLGDTGFKKWCGTRYTYQGDPPALERMIKRLANDASKRASRRRNHSLGSEPNALIAAVQFLREIAK
jgi:hypothetical protein